MAHKYYCGCAGKVSGEKDYNQRMSALQKLEDSGDWIAEPKYDGIWIAATRMDHAHNVFWSRPGKQKDLGKFPTLPPGTILIGEAAYGSQTGRKLRDQKGHDFIYVYDILMLDEVPVYQMSRTHRQECLSKFYDKYPDLSDHYERSPVFTKDFCREYLNQPEGLILKPVSDGPYTLGGKKVKHWMKAKKSDTSDYVILDKVMSTAETKVGRGMIRHLVCGGWVESSKVYRNDTVYDKKVIDNVDFSLVSLVDVGSMEHYWCQEFADNFDKYKGSVIEVGHFGTFDSGSCRHPFFCRLRDDKSSEECIYRS